MTSSPQGDGNVSEEVLTLIDVHFMTSSPQGDGNGASAIANAVKIS